MLGMRAGGADHNDPVAVGPDFCGHCAICKGVFTHKTLHRYLLPPIQWERDDERSDPVPPSVHPLGVGMCRRAVCQNAPFWYMSQVCRSTAPYCSRDAGAFSPRDVQLISRYAVCGGTGQKHSLLQFATIAGGYS
jgi:hypothetical protein